jgi:signal transduction histidine kinase/DNA-binding response OmpR family regulator/ligand-binding sensor domain-containing protein
MKKHILPIVFLSFVHLMYAQNPEIKFDRFSYAQGLNDDNITSILQDPKGFLWVAGSRLHKYDGYTFTTVANLPGSKVFPADTLVCPWKMTQDCFGLIWIQYAAGLVIYNPEDQKSINLLKTFCLFDTTKNISWEQNLNLFNFSGDVFWISTKQGIIKMSYKKGIPGEVIKKKLFDKKLSDIFNVDTFRISINNESDMIHVVYEDSWKNIWVGGEFGLYLMQPGEKSFTLVDYDSKGICKLPVTDFDFIIQENEDSFLVGSWYGMFRMTNVKNALMGKKPDKSLLEFHRKMLFQNATAILKDRNRNIYVASAKNIFLMETDKRSGTDSFKALYPLSPDNDKEQLIWPRSLFQDASGAIWVALSQNGMLRFNIKRSQFTSYKKEIFGTKERVDGNFLLQDHEGNVWTGGDKLYKVNLNNLKTVFYKIGPDWNFIQSVCEIKPGIFWIGSFRGVSEFNSATGKFRDPFPHSVLSEKLKNRWIYDILKDGHLVYICTEGGLFVYDFSVARLHNFGTNHNKSGNEDIHDTFKSIIKTKDGAIWVSTVGLKGVYKIRYNSSEESMSFEQLKINILSERNILKSNNTTLFEDHEGIIWVGNNNTPYSLHSIDPASGKIKSFDLFGKLFYGEIESITEDNQDNLWIGSDIGLYRFSKRTAKIKKFTWEEDGLPIHAHAGHSFFKDKSGRIFIAGTGGFYSFHPDSLKTNTAIPRIVITDFRLNKKSIPVNSVEKPILTRNISYTGEIELDHDQNDLEIEFAALDFTESMKNRYAYKLEGYKDEWVQTNAGNRVATFTNLSPGTYIFHVRGSNNDGIWNEKGTSLRIVIRKPWWGTIFAWIVYSLMFVASIAAFIWWRLSALEKDKLKLEIEVRERTQEIEKQKDEIVSQRNLVEKQNEQILELDQLRTRFFTNISHEFRTPLALIQSPVEELLDDPRRNEKERRKLNIVQRNAGRLLDLVNQLLDISKMDGRSMKLALYEGDVMKHLHALARNFTSMAELKSILFKIIVAKEQISTWYDPDKLEKIAVNILSNAFKFTPEGGEIIFSADYQKSNDPMIPHFLKFSVTDTGTGIPKDSLEKVFDRFYQVESSVKKEGGGTGIGLSLARDMARIMHGDITVESELCKGSVFSVNVPLGKDFLVDQEYFILKQKPSGYILSMKDGEDSEINENPQTEEITQVEKPIILIVEDNGEIRMQLMDNLSGEYMIIESIDGIAGLRKAIETVPDLIITDIMMPRMDGRELCHALKNDERTSHIPVIMLTAKVTQIDRINGLRTGADDFIPKPFVMAELKARVANLLLQRQRQREKYSRAIKLDPSDIFITPLDEQFLKRAIEIVERHISEENFDLIEFRSEMNMSRSTLFRKLHALTGESPTEFIRNIRLKRAASLIKNKFGNVTQVSYEVGFNNLSNFNKTFRKFYGVSPTEYARKNITIDNQ